ncbi:MAG: OmpH family outer membrane protein [Candidatus Aureabacteria bacterium]|nr:OmpH family outer membrane protein [Candidatus Auribacterota bacterium]
MKFSVVAMICGILAGVMCAGSAAMAAGGKTGFVDVEKVFAKYQKTVELNGKLQQERKDKIAERKSMVEGINKLKDEADLLRDEAKRQKEAAVDEKVKALYQFEEKVKREAMQKQARLQEEILGEIKGAIAETGKGEGYDIIFAATGDDIGYHAERLDLTEQIVKILNKKRTDTK